MNKLQRSFERIVSDESDTMLLSEYWHFLRQNKKWWMLPILIAMLLLGFLLALSGTAAAPFIYTLF